MPSEHCRLKQTMLQTAFLTVVFTVLKYCAEMRELCHNAALPYLGHREFAVVEAWQTCPNPIWGSFYFSEFFHYGTDRRTKSANR
ncbi:hypothetical protein ACKJOL_04135 [Neisseria cinerea]|uniref:hypothetical protein n=1 Tax=Neisseria TaxID=482 RepID=UPI00272A6D48|nr:MULTISPECIES: hypothetical protein [Neisseria]